MRSATVQKGEARGWHVTAWLKEPRKARGDGGHVVHWRVRSPRRSHVYDTFHSTVGKANLRDNVNEAVYKHIYRQVRPELMRQIKDRRAVLQGVKFSSSRRALAAPVRPVDNGLLATQCFVTPVKEKAPSGTWTCKCEAHLRRHPRCVPSGEGQPELVHLLGNTSIGRGESSDLVLESRLTPQMISRCHAELVHKKAGRGFRIEDKKSTNGLLVNGQRVSGGQDLEPGDVITFGAQTHHPEFDYIFETRPVGAASSLRRSSAALQDVLGAKDDDEAWLRVQPEQPEGAQPLAAQPTQVADQQPKAASAEVAEGMEEELQAVTQQQQQQQQQEKEEKGFPVGVILPEGQAEGKPGQEGEEEGEEGEEADRKGEKDGKEGCPKSDLKVESEADVKQADVKGEEAVKEEREDEAEAVGPALAEPAGP